MVDRLERARIVVYVEQSLLPSALRGRLVFVTTSGGWPYVRVQIDCRQIRDDQMVMLGHELRHAIEVADAGIANDASLQALYRTIGFATDNTERRFESDAARDAALMVRRDLLSPPASTK